MDLVACQLESPLRPPDWRWKRAGYRHEEGVRSRRGRDDPWVDREVRFRKALARSGGDLGHPKLAKADAAVVGACRLWSGDDRRLQWEVEARLLAGQEADGVAARTAVPADAVGAYGKLFFDVADRLRHPDWVAASVLGNRFFTGLTRDDVGLIWKWIGYQFGAFALDALLDTLYGGSAGSPHGGAVAHDPALAAAFERLIAVLTIRVTPENALQVIRLDRLARGIERAAAADRVVTFNPPVVAATEPVFTTAVSPDAPSAPTNPKCDVRPPVADGLPGEEPDGDVEVLARRTA